MFVNASQLTIQPPPLNRSNSLPVLDMSSATANHPVPLLQPLNVPRYMPHSMSHTRMTAIDSTPPQGQVQLPAKSMYDWPGPGPRIASLLPPEHLGTPLVGHRALAEDMGYHQAQAYPYAAQNFWIGGTDQNGDTSYGMLQEERPGNQELARRRHVCPVCDKRFNRPSSLNTHMAVHTGAKPFMCGVPDCGRRFSVSSNLRRHEKTHNVRSRDEHESPFNHQPAEQSSARSGYMTHGQSSSIPNMSNFSMSTITNERPSTSYSDNSHTPRYTSMSQPSANEYTPYHAYSYPMPQPHPAHGHPHGLGNDIHQSSYQYSHNPMTLPQPLPSSSTVDFGDFLNAMPPSASGFGTNLENYQVVSGSKHSRVASSSGGVSGNGEAMSRGSSASGSGEMIGTPTPVEVDLGQGQSHGQGQNGLEVDAEGMDEDIN